MTLNISTQIDPETGMVERPDYETVLTGTGEKSLLSETAGRLYAYRSGRDPNTLRCV
jgi:hypothetical protein